MDQDDIFKLLLIILLISNEKDSYRHDGEIIDGERHENRNFFTSINEVIIIALLLNSFSSSRRRDEHDHHRFTTF